MNLKTHIRIYNKLKSDRAKPQQQADKYRQSRAKKHIQPALTDKIDYKKLQKNSKNIYKKLYKSDNPFTTTGI